jgi:predicted NBD/HSP70 family sugar kinase
VTGLVGALELGGTHVSAGRVDMARSRVDPSGLRRFSLDVGGSRDDLLETITKAALDVRLPEIELWGVATPGPFDYERGISKIRGLGKLDALYEVDVRDRLARDLGIARPERVCFLNDAHAFVLGEWWAGAAKGHARAMGVTLGTGLGSGFLAGGQLVVYGLDVPPDARLDLVPFRGGAVEDVVSSRGIVSAFGDGLDLGANLGVADIARRARDGEARAVAVFRGFGSALGEFLEPWVVRFAPTCLVFGGSITRAWNLFGEGFLEACPPAAHLDRCSPADHLEESPLLGAALHALRAHPELA